MSLGRQKKTFFSPKLGHSYSAIALRWLLAKKNKSAAPKRKRGEIFALNFMCCRFVVKVINLRERRNGACLCCGDYSYFFSLPFVVPLVYFSTFFFSSAFFVVFLFGKKLDFFSSFSPLVSLSLPRRHKHATTTEDILYTRTRIKREELREHLSPESNSERERG